MAEWKFPSNDYGEIKGINDSGVAMFKGTPLKSLAREICQNSLDAANADITKVEFSKFSIPTRNLPDSKVLKDTFERCKVFWGSQKALTTKEFYENAYEEISKEYCSVLRISDFNTKGLTGPREEINSDWSNLTKSSGASDKKGTAGGSYGIGKFAPFACSMFSTVFYSTLNINNEEAYQGVARLVTFRRDDGETTQGIGYYGNERNTPCYEQLQLDPCFKRDCNNYGTDIFIIGYKHSNETWEKDIITSILDSFLGAIWNEKLQVKVGDIEINKSNLQEILEVYRDDLLGQTDKYYMVLSSKETKWYKENFLGLGEIKLGLLIGDDNATKKVAMIRKTGMKIMEKNRVLGSFPVSGVMFINGDEINTRLRIMENPEHTEWQPDRSKNPLQSRQLLKSLNSFIKNKIEELMHTGESTSVDAVGVGKFIPDVMDESNDKNLDEIVSNEIFEIHKKEVKKKIIKNKNEESESRVTITLEEDEDEMEYGGTDEMYSHNNGKKISNGGREAEPAHHIVYETSKETKISQVGMDKFITICVNKRTGRYSLMIVPNSKINNGVIELFLSGEEGKYEAPVKDAIQIGGNKLKVEKNKIYGLSTEVDKPIKISLGLDYYDYCSMEALLYEIKK